MNRQDTKDTRFRGLDPGIDRLARDVVDAALEVHRALGPGFLESVYEEALRVEFGLRRLPFVRQPVVSLSYKGEPIGDSRLDFLLAGKLVAELKAVDTLADIHTAQVISYLKATGCRLGLLINFNVPLLKSGIKRIIL